MAWLLKCCVLPGPFRFAGLLTVSTGQTGHLLALLQQCKAVMCLCACCQLGLITAFSAGQVCTAVQLIALQSRGLCCSLSACILALMVDRVHAMPAQSSAPGPMIIASISGVHVCRSDPCSVYIHGHTALSVAQATGSFAVRLAASHFAFHSAPLPLCAPAQY